MSERDLNLALDAIDQNLCNIEHGEDITDETDQLFDELDEESAKYIDPELVEDDEDEEENYIVVDEAYDAEV